MFVSLQSVTHTLNQNKEQHLPSVCIIFGHGTLIDTLKCLWVGFILA